VSTPLATADPAAATVSQAIRNDSLWLFSGYAATAGIGFVFWVVAALRVPPEALGADAALISVFTAAAAITSSGIGSAMVVMLPVAGGQRAHLVRVAYLATVGIGLVAGLLAGGIAAAMLPAAGLPAGVTVALVTAMTMVWAVFNVQDQVLTGLNAARWTLFLNGPANLAKLLLTVVLTLPLLAVAHPVVLATILPAAAAAVFTVTWLVPRLLRQPVAVSADAVDGPTGTGWLAALRAFALRDTAAIGLLLGVGLLTPFLVTVLAGPTQGALYAIAYQISVALDLVNNGVATALAKNSSGARSTGIVLSGRLLGRVLVVVALAAAAITAATPLAFGLLGRGYDPARATLVVGLLSLGCLARTPYGIWSSLMRAHHRVTPVLAGNASTAVVLVVLAIGLVPAAGAAGAACAMLVSGLWAGALGIVGLRRLRRQSTDQGGEHSC